MENGDERTDALADAAYGPVRLAVEALTGDGNLPSRVADAMFHLTPMLPGDLPNGLAARFEAIIAKWGDSEAKTEDTPRELAGMVLDLYEETVRRC